MMTFPAPKPLTHAEDIRAAFAMGWIDGRDGRGPRTMREALDAYGRPVGERGLGWDDELCSTYLNGREDGERGDTFRLHGAPESEMAR